jgi:hypothetical protein
MEQRFFTWLVEDLAVGPLETEQLQVEQVDTLISVFRLLQATVIVLLLEVLDLIALLVL